MKNYVNLVGVFGEVGTLAKMFGVGKDGMSNFLKVHPELKQKLSDDHTLTAEDMIMSGYKLKLDENRSIADIEKSIAHHASGLPQELEQLVKECVQNLEQFAKQNKK